MHMRLLCLGLCFVFVSFFANAATWFVDAAASGSATGDSWGNAFTSIQDAVDAATADADDVVWVATGVYTGAGDAVLTMKSGVDIYGGFTAGDSQLSDRDWETNLTYIDGEYGRRCVVGADDALLDGFTIRRGRLTGHGAGMVNDGVSPTVLHCVFTDNAVLGTGMTGGRGGAVYNTSSSPVIGYCTFLNNTTSSGGGGMYNYLATGEVHHCVFEGNETDPSYAGGGIFLSESATVIRNCRFFGNTSNSGCGLGTYRSAAEISNCVFAGNTAGASVNAGAGVFISSDPAPTITNCIIWGNTPDDFYAGGATTTVTYSLIGDGYSGTGNLDADPRFVDLAGGDLRLSGGSPCIDAGDDSVVEDATDLDGNARQVGVVDMGAYELKASVLSTEPAAYAQAVATDATVSATFNVDLGAIDASTKIFQLYSGAQPLQNGAQASLSYDNADPYVLTLTPSAAFGAGQRVMAGVYAGDVDVVPYYWSFNVAVAELSSGMLADSGQSLGASDAYAVALGDLDGDGDLDAFVACAGAANTVWLNDGAGAFTDSAQSLGNAQSRDVVLADFDDDGDLDAFVVNAGEANKVWLNDGSAVFSDSGQSLGTADSRAAAVADADGDGDLDVFVVNYNQSNVLWLNDGAGAFSDSGQTLGNAASTAVAGGDVDLDGDWDFLVSNYAQANVLWLNNGSGVLTDSGQSLGVYNCNAVALDDLDADGAPDIFWANNGEADQVFLNDGVGNFSNSAQDLGSGAGSDVALGDVDGDGDLDAFVTDASGANTVWLNDGAAVFSDSAQTLGTAESRGVALGDVDDDGSLDAFVANTSGNDALWLNLAAAEVVTEAASDVSAASAILNGRVDSEGGATITERGFYWGTSPLDTSDLSSATQEVITPDPGGTGSFSKTISGLTEGVVHYYLAYAQSAAGTRYGSQQTFSLKESPVITWATPAAITYGVALSAVQLNATANVPGAFEYLPATESVLDAGSQTLSVTFTPTDTASYATITSSVTLQVNRATPTVSTWPDASAITYGDALGSSTLSGGTPSVAGAFSFAAPTTTPSAGSYAAAVIFTPTDTLNYETASGTVSVEVGKATPTIVTWPISEAITYGESLSSAGLSGDEASVAGNFDYNSPWIIPQTGDYIAAITFTPKDTQNYFTVPGTVTVTVEKATPSITTWPQASTITVGEALSDSTLTGGAASVLGVFAFDRPDLLPPVSSYNATVIFTPGDTTNYATVSGVVAVEVTKATPSVSTWPIASSLSYGQPLLRSVLSGGEASVEGTFTFKTLAYVPDTGTYNATVVFNPTNASNYLSVEGTVPVVVNKGIPTVSTWPAASALTYGANLSASTLSGGAASMSGSFEFSAPWTVPPAGTYDAAVDFVPDDDEHYETVSGTVQVAVAKATAVVQFNALTQFYDGTAKEVEVVTIPAGLSVTVLYDGETTAPSSIGEYSVTATVDETNYVGNASGTFEIRVATEGESCLREFHSADINQDNTINLSELLRVVQFYNSGGLHCATPSDSTEDGYVAHAGANQDCCPHSADYRPDPTDWVIDITELLRIIQLYNSNAYYFCPENPSSDDTYCAGVASGK